MIDGVILISTSLGQVYYVASNIKSKNYIIVNKVFATAGPYDLVVLVTANTVSQIGKFVVEDLQTVAGVSSTLTMVSIDDQITVE